MTMFAWFDENLNMWYAVDAKSEKCHGGFYAEKDVESWILLKGHNLIS